MIKLFRHIRQRLLSENKLSKYLLYAIGEIILVVIGILIALSINNWNTDKDLRAQEEYLISLREEFKSNLQSIDGSIQEAEQQVNDIEALLRLFDPSLVDTISDSRIAKTLNHVLARAASYNPSTGVLTDLTSSGNLILIQNNGLRQDLASFGNSLARLDHQQSEITTLLNGLKDQYKRLASIRNLMLDLGSTFPERSISETMSYKDVFNSVEFENMLLDYYLTTESLKSERFYLAIKEEIEGVLKKIDSELNES